MHHGSKGFNLVFFVSFGAVCARLSGAAVLICMLGLVLSCAMHNIAAGSQQHAGHRVYVCVYPNSLSSQHHCPRFRHVEPRVHTLYSDSCGRFVFYQVLPSLVVCPLVCVFPSSSKACSARIFGSWFGSQVRWDLNTKSGALNEDPRLNKSKHK